MKILMSICSGIIMTGVAYSLYNAANDYVDSQEPNVCVKDEQGVYVVDIYEGDSTNGDTTNGKH